MCCKSTVTYKDPLTELVVERAKAGELDPERICIDVPAALGVG